MVRQQKKKTRRDGGGGCKLEPCHVSSYIFIFIFHMPYAHDDVCGYPL